MEGFRSIRPLRAASDLRNQAWYPVFLSFYIAGYLIYVWQQAVMDRRERWRWRVVDRMRSRREQASVCDTHLWRREGEGGGEWGNCRERAAKSMKGAVREFTSIESWDCFRWLRITKLFCSFSRPSERSRSWMHKLGNAWCSSPDPGGVGHTWSHGVVEPIMQQAQLCCLRAPQQKVQPGQGSQCKAG